MASGGAVDEELAQNCAVCLLVAEMIVLPPNTRLTPLTFGVVAGSAHVFGAAAAWLSLSRLLASVALSPLMLLPEASIGVPPITLVGRVHDEPDGRLK